jgi:predicted tellurium resistance membrane protein TerC
MRRSLKYYVSLFLSIIGAILIWETFKNMIGGSPLKAIFVDYRLYVGIILLSLGFFLYKPQSKKNNLESK